MRLSKSEGGPRREYWNKRCDLISGLANFLILEILAYFKDEIDPLTR